MSRQIGAWAVAAVLASGCAAERQPSAPSAALPPPSAAAVDTRELVAYFAAVGRAGAPAQKRELAQSAAAFGRTRTPYSRLRLGGLYAQPAPVLRDDARALALLEPLALTHGIAAPQRPVADLAALLYAQVAERQRLAKGEAKKQEDLRERIEAMRSIERSIMDREDRQRR
jgi:hypothetical protein